MQFRLNRRLAQRLWGNLSIPLIATLKNLSSPYGFLIARGDITYLNGGWYVTHSGLLGLAVRRHCAGIHVTTLPNFCDPHTSRWAFKAMVFPRGNNKGFTGYGDADPSNVSPLVYGAEMRVAETRAVNRALRKAYGIGICSVEELGSLSESPHYSREPKKLPSRPTSGNGFAGPKVRDRLCQIIRQHQLDPTLVKSYATEFCGV